MRKYIYISIALFWVICICSQFVQSGDNLQNEIGKTAAQLASITDGVTDADANYMEAFVTLRIKRLVSRFNEFRFSSDYADIFAAIDSGNVIFINPGDTLNLTQDSLHLTSNFAILGAGPTSIIKMTKSSDATVYGIINLAGVENILIADVKIVGDTTAGMMSEHDHGIRMAEETLGDRSSAECHNIIISDVIFDEIAGDAINIRGHSSKILINNCIMESDSVAPARNRCGIAIIDGQDIAISNCYILSGDVASIDLEPNAGDTIRNVIISNCILQNDNDGIGISINAPNAGTFIDNVFIDNCYIKNTQVEAIAVRGVDGGRTQNVHISNTIIEDCNETGALHGAFTIHGYVNNVFCNNLKVLNSPKLGCLILSNQNSVYRPHDISFVNCSFEDNAWGGMFVSVSNYSTTDTVFVKQLIIANSMFRNNGDGVNTPGTDWYGIKLQGIRHSSISNNIIVDTNNKQNKGMLLAYCDSSAVIGNVVFGNDSGAVSWLSCSHLDMAHNVLNTGTYFVGNYHSDVRVINEFGIGANDGGEDRFFNIQGGGTHDSTGLKSVNSFNEDCFYVDGLGRGFLRKYRSAGRPTGSVVSSPIAEGNFYVSNNGDTLNWYLNSNWQTIWKPGGYLLSADFGDSLVNYDGDGLIITDNDAIDVNVDNATIEIDTDALRIKANGINDTHIDWGAGANQVDSDDVPEGSSNLYQLTEEEVEDYIGAGMSGNTETRIAVTYQDADGTFDFVVDDMNDDIPEAGDFGNAADLDANGEVADNSHNHNFLNASDNNPDSVIYVDASGNVGIGTTSPFTPIELKSTDLRFRFNVDGGVADKKTYEIRAIGAAGYEGLQFRSVNDANSVYATQLFLQYGGNVGIGTTSPDYKLDIKATSSIGSITFTGTGLDDMTNGGTFIGASALNYRIEIDGLNPPFDPDEFKWSDDGGSTWDATGVTITGSAQTLNNGVTITFGSTSGHTVGDRWDFSTTVTNPLGIQNAAGTRSLIVDNDNDIRVPYGIIVGTDQDANRIDDGTHGAASTTLYIGNETIDTSAPSGSKVIRGDNTAGCVLRRIRLNIENGTNANTIKCSVTDMWNGDAIALTDNIVKNGTTGNFTLSVNGNILTIEASGLSGNVLMALGTLSYNASSVSILVQCQQSANDIYTSWRYSTSATTVDLTSLVDYGNIRVDILYMTDG